jgi:hypothetical protein
MLKIRFGIWWWKIFIPGAYQVKQEDFSLISLYRPVSVKLYYWSKDAAGNAVPFPLIQLLTISGWDPLLKVFNLDKLNYNNDPQTGGDGFLILYKVLQSILKMGD